MLRSIIPFALVCLGFAIVGLARDMPLLEWKISEIKADIPPGFHIKPSPWTTRLGESLLGNPLDNNAYFLWQVYTPMENSKDICSPVGSKPLAKRSQNDKTIEQFSMDFYQNVYPWLWKTSWLFLFLSGIYIWWFAILYKHSVSEAVLSTVLITMLSCLFFDSVLHPLTRRIMPALPCELFLPSHPYSGTIVFYADLSKIHYEMLITLFTGISLELGAVGVMLYQTMKAISRRKKSTQPIVG